MAKSLSHQHVLFPISAAGFTNARRRRARQVAVVLLGLALVVVSPQVGFGQSTQQQEEQQREQQEREQQQRDQQQREQQEREQQQRDQQQRDQQERDQQQRDQQQREQQEREQQLQHSASDSSAQSSNASSEDSRPTTARPTAADVKRPTSDIQPAGAEGKINSAPAVSATATNDHASTPVKSPTPVQPKPVASGPPSKHQACPAGESEGKDGACSASRVVKNGVVTNAKVPGVGSARNSVQQPCAAGQVWDGAQCVAVGPQPCLPGQSGVGTSCQPRGECTSATASAQSVIVELRSARQEKDQVCLQNPNGQECQAAEAHYSLTLNEYRNFLGSVPTECQTELPDPIAI